MSNYELDISGQSLEAIREYKKSLETGPKRPGTYLMLEIIQMQGIEIPNELIAAQNFEIPGTPPQNVTNQKELLKAIRIYQKGAFGKHDEYDRNFSLIANFINNNIDDATFNNAVQNMKDDKFIRAIVRTKSPVYMAENWLQRDVTSGRWNNEEIPLLGSIGYTLDAEFTHDGEWAAAKRKKTKPHTGKIFFTAGPVSQLVSELEKISVDGKPDFDKTYEFFESRWLAGIKSAHARAVANGEKIEIALPGIGTGLFAKGSNNAGLIQRNFHACVEKFFREHEAEFPNIVSVRVVTFNELQQYTKDLGRIQIKHEWAQNEQTPRKFVKLSKDQKTKMLALVAADTCSAPFCCANQSEIENINQASFRSDEEAALGNVDPKVLFELYGIIELPEGCRNIDDYIFKIKCGDIEGPQFGDNCDIIIDGNKKLVGNSVALPTSTVTHQDLLDKIRFKINSCRGFKENLAKITPFYSKMSSNVSSQVLGELEKLISSNHDDATIIRNFKLYYEMVQNNEKPSKRDHDFLREFKDIYEDAKLRTEGLVVTSGAGLNPITMTASVRVDATEGFVNLFEQLTNSESIQEPLNKKIKLGNETYDVELNSNGFIFIGRIYENEETNVKVGIEIRRLDDGSFIVCNSKNAGELSINEFSSRGVELATDAKSVHPDIGLVGENYEQFSYQAQYLDNMLDLIRSNNLIEKICKVYKIVPSRYIGIEEPAAATSAYGAE